MAIATIDYTLYIGNDTEELEIEVDFHNDLNGEMVIDYIAAWVGNERLPNWLEGLIIKSGDLEDMAEEILVAAAA